MVYKVNQNKYTYICIYMHAHISYIKTHCSVMLRYTLCRFVASA